MKTLITFATILLSTLLSALPAKAETIHFNELQPYSPMAVTDTIMPGEEMQELEQLEQITVF